MEKHLSPDSGLSPFLGVKTEILTGTSLGLWEHPEERVELCKLPFRGTDCELLGIFSRHRLLLAVRSSAVGHEA